MKLLVRLLNRISIKRKLYLMLIICVFIPLFFTDGLFLSMMFRAEMRDDESKMNNVAESVQFVLTDYSDSGYIFLNNLTSNRKVNQFLSQEYSSPLNYYENLYEVTSSTLFANERYDATIYTGMNGFISGGSFQQLKKYRETEWYKEYISIPNKYMLYVNYDQTDWRNERNFSIVSIYDHYKQGETKLARDLIKVDFNYSDIQLTIDNSKYTNNVYVCLDDRIIFTNDQKEKGGLASDFMRLNDSILTESVVKKSFTLYDKTFDIYVMSNENIMEKTLKGNAWLIALLVGFNIVIPFMVLNLFNKSFTDRLTQLTESIENKDDESLKTVAGLEGSDEITKLTEAYNTMATRINYLIDNEYKERLKRQEMDIARQRAELHALHSQINPHFLFNALESIRMHSLIKKENETARMVEKLAIIQRQNVEWGDDFVKVSDEIRFVEAYLELQKYRFGQRLLYEISVDEDCEDIRIPKITLVTFVENACVHGMENKTSSCWIFVRISKEYNELVLEVEDTGNGIEEDACRQLLEDINSVTMESIRSKKSIGILNAALRLKMFTENRVRFELESEKGVGTIITIKIPIEEHKEVQDV